MYSLSQRGIGLIPLLFELAAVGSMLDPTTESTVPHYSGLYGRPDLMAAFRQALRDRHLAPAGVMRDDANPHSARFGTTPATACLIRQPKGIDRQVTPFAVGQKSINAHASPAPTVRSRSSEMDSDVLVMFAPLAG